MKTISLNAKPLIISVLFDFIAVALIFLIPSFSHLVGIPLYILDPMRLMVFAGILITNKKNSYIIAILLPLVSFIISSHPYFYKIFLISGELLLNLWLFYALFEKSKNVFLSSLLSIIASKAIYYLFKYLMISALLINDSLVSTSIYVQLMVTVVLSIIMALTFRKTLANE